MLVSFCCKVHSEDNCSPPLLPFSLPASAPPPGLPPLILARLRPSSLPASAPPPCQPPPLLQASICPASLPASGPHPCPSMPITALNIPVQALHTLTTLPPAMLTPPPAGAGRCGAGGGGNDNSNATLSVARPARPSSCTPAAVHKPARTRPARLRVQSARPHQPRATEIV